MTGFPEHDYTGPPEPKPTGAGLACAGGICAGDAADVESSSPAGEEDGHNHARCMKHHHNNKKFCDCKLTHKKHYCKKTFLVTNGNENYLVLILSYFRLFRLIFGLFSLFQQILAYLELMVLIFYYYLKIDQK